MFRPMRRMKQALSKEEILTILKGQPRGVLSVQGDDGYPYGMPMNFWYCEEDGKLYFHGAKIGHKIEAMKRNDKVSFCIYDEGCHLEGDWALTINCVILFGRVKFLEDYEKSMEVSRALSHKFTQDEDYIDYEIQKFGPGTLCFAMEIEHITGKRVNEK